MAITTQNLSGKGNAELVKVKITSGVRIAGIGYGVGEIITVYRNDANMLFTSNKAVPVADEPEKPTTRVPEETLTRAPDEPKKTRRKYTKRVK